MHNCDIWEWPAGGDLFASLALAPQTAVADTAGRSEETEEALNAGDGADVLDELPYDEWVAMVDPDRARREFEELAQEIEAAVEASGPPERLWWEFDQPGAGGSSSSSGPTGCIAQDIHLVAAPHVASPQTPPELL
jgi:hypothetical protein